jgi:hypothetical protein
MARLYCKVDVAGSIDEVDVMTAPLARVSLTVARCGVVWVGGGCTCRLVAALLMVMPRSRSNCSGRVRRLLLLAVVVVVVVEEEGEEEVLHLHEVHDCVSVMHLSQTAAAPAVEQQPLTHLPPPPASLSQQCINCHHQRHLFINEAAAGTHRRLACVDVCSDAYIAYQRCR